MRTTINRNTHTDVLATRQDRIVVATIVALRAAALALPLFSGQFFQALADFQRAIKRGLKSATGAARATETTLVELVSYVSGLSRCWHPVRRMPHHAVVRVDS